MVHIVGIGPGSREYMLYEAVKVLESSDVVIGFERALESIEFLKVNKIIMKSLNEILDYINKNSEEISIAASGDPCFFGISDYINKNYNGEFNIVPGISSFQYMTAKLKKSWSRSYLGSLHGRCEDFLKKVIENDISIWLTDKANSPEFMIRTLYENKVSAKVFIGENLSYDNERIVEGSVGSLLDKAFDELCVVVIEREK